MVLLAGAVLSDEVGQTFLSACWWGSVAAWRGRQECLPYCPGKANCLVLDYGGNVLRHGPVDQLLLKDKARLGEGEAPAKECPTCRASIAPAYSTCPQCGHEFPPPERRKHDAQASRAGALAGQTTDTEFEVRDITYSVHTKKDADESAPKTLRVDYRLGLDRQGRVESPWG